MSRGASSHTPTNEVEEYEAIAIDSNSEKCLRNVKENAVVVLNEEEVTGKISKAGRKRKSDVWHWFKVISVNEKGPKGAAVPKRKAQCSQCKKKYGLNISGSTSHLLRHVETCHEIKRAKGESQSVQDGLDKIVDCIVKIREGVKYLRKSPARLFKFGEQAIQLGIATRRSLCSDVKTRWNSTHRMLQSALYYKSTLERYAKRDTTFKWLPTELEWANTEKVVKLLDVFTKATNLFSGTAYPTSNLFFNEVFKVKRAICEAYGSSDNFLSTMAQVMFVKFEKYWGEVSLLMTIASILDPRFKMNLIGFCFKKLYQSYEVEARIEEVRSKVELLFQKYERDYVASNSVAGSSTLLEDDLDNTQPEDDYFHFVFENQIEESPKTDLEVYLEEKVLVVGQGENFDVLEWWKVNCVKFPILSKVARDVLCIPISTVASESAFSAGGRVLDDYRSSLTRDMVELLVCGGDWIRASSTVTMHTLQQAVKEEENLEVQIPMEKTD